MFYKQGEKAAQKFKEEFPELVVVNRCKVCGAYKKTPKARLSFKCGKMTESYFE